MSRLRIAGGHLIDPTHGVDGIADVWIEDGRVVEAPTDPDIRADRTIDARGFVVMPAGVDVHCHIAGPKVNSARILRPEEARLGAFPRSKAAGSRSGCLGSVPTSFSTGAKYAGLGYATAVDAAIAPLGARPAHHEFRDTPIIDKAFLVLLGNNHYAMDRIRLGERERLRAFVAWILGATKGFGIKVVNPGGVEKWKQGEGNVASLDEVVPHFEVTPRQILTEIARAVDDLGLPHPMHLHGLNLGLPGNASTTLETLRALDGHRAHLAHIQFHSYGGEPGNLGQFDSHAGPLADYINTHPNLSVDVGQVMFGETTSMTADGAVGQFLHKVNGRKWVSHDLEMETGCGVVPITYDDKNAVHALQWAIGLEWYLRVDDPWRIAMSTDHPNGGSFLAYPQIIALLMDRGYRADALKALPDRVRARSGLGDLSREYSLSEIAIITRAAPARMLGLANKGHLGPGADGDVTIYSPDDDKERMFAIPRYLIKGGEVVLDDGELRRWADGRTLHVAPDSDPSVDPEIAGWFERSSSIAFANFPVQAEEVANAHSIPVSGGGKTS
ncbi:formylmethanofuran dehydrogenase subunit A [Tundrisphaera lichenicola]|uniref:formylmethanofuran dehydrogenase subunit A n=1 Tax=Tundrisphaera lichenicola TaxID=2029860 RepID=UPI003EBE0BB6